MKPGAARAGRGSVFLQLRSMMGHAEIERRWAEQDRREWDVEYFAARVQALLAAVRSIEDEPNAAEEALAARFYQLIEEYRRRHE